MLVTTNPVLYFEISDQRPLYKFGLCVFRIPLADRQHSNRKAPEREAIATCLVKHTTRHFFRGTFLRLLVV